MLRTDIPLYSLFVLIFQILCLNSVILNQIYFYPHLGVYLMSFVLACAFNNNEMFCIYFCETV